MPLSIEPMPVDKSTVVTRYVRVGLHLLVAGVSLLVAWGILLHGMDIDSLLPAQDMPETMRLEYNRAALQAEGIYSLGLKAMAAGVLWFALYVFLWVRRARKTDIKE